MTDTFINELLLTERASRVQVGSGTALFSVGDDCQNFVIVSQGSVRVELLSSSGQQVIVMTTSCLLGSSDYFAQALSETDCELILIPKGTFNAQLNESEAFRDFVFKGFHHRLSHLLERTAELATSSVDQRLADALLLHSTHSNPANSVSLTHEQLAIEVGTAREVISRRLAAMEQQGLVERQRGSIKICDAQKLSQLR